VNGVIHGNDRIMCYYQGCYSNTISKMADIAVKKKAKVLLLSAKNKNCYITTGYFGTQWTAAKQTVCRLTTQLRKEGLVLEQNCACVSSVCSVEYIEILRVAAK